MLAVTLDSWILMAGAGFLLLKKIIHNLRELKVLILWLLD